MSKCLGVVDPVSLCVPFATSLTLYHSKVPSALNIDVNTSLQPTVGFPFGSSSTFHV